MQENFGKAVKKKLIDLDQTQYWLTREVNLLTGMSIDRTYLNKVINGEKKSQRVQNAISAILGLGS